MKRLLASLVLIGGCLLVSTQRSARKCFTPRKGDSSDFGFALAVSDDYLAVGDPKANRVVLYHRDARGSWARTQEILPPEGSTAAKVGSGFGYALDLDDLTLIIGAHHQILSGVTPGATLTGIANPGEKRPRSEGNRGIRFVSGIFLVDIPKEMKELKVKSISSNTFLEDAVYGFDVSIDGAFIAFGLRKEIRPGLWHGSIGVLHSETSWQEVEIIAPPTSAEAMVNFGVSTDIANNLLIAAAPRSGTQGAAYLIDLTRKSGWQQLLKDETPPANGFFGGQVSLSSNLAFLGGHYGGPFESSSAIVTMSGNKQGTVRYIFPGGSGVVNNDFAVIIPTPPLVPLWYIQNNPANIKPEKRLTFKSPTLNIVNQTVEHLIKIQHRYIKDPYTGNKFHPIQTAAIGNDFIVLTQRDSNSDCKVFVKNISQFNSSTSSQEN